MSGKDGMQGGHFIPRGVIATRWDPLNIQPQCPRCNGFRNGAYIEYSNWFINHYGKELYDQYIEAYNQHKRGEFSGFRLLEVAAMYNKWLSEGRELEKKVGRQLFPKTWKDYIM